MGLRHLISACLEADNLHFADIYGFRGCGTLSTEMGSFSYAALASFAKLFAKFSKVYDRDCLRMYKMLIYRKMRNAKKNLCDFRTEKRPFSHF